MSWVAREAPKPTSNTSDRATAIATAFYFLEAQRVVYSVLEVVEPLTATAPVALPVGNE